eukprot:3784571-Pyramimonas_sp.AAC.1
MPLPANACSNLPPPVPTTIAPPGFPSADSAGDPVAYCVVSSHNVQVADDLLGARKTPDLDTIYTARQSEAACVTSSRSFFRRNGLWVTLISVRNLTTLNGGFLDPLAAVARS